MLSNHVHVQTGCMRSDKPQMLSCHPGAVPPAVAACPVAMLLSALGATCRLCRSVYITKQVSFRNRVLILFDWLKAQVFGRDLSNY